MGFSRSTKSITLAYTTTVISYMQERRSYPSLKKQTGPVHNTASSW